MAGLLGLVGRRGSGEFSEGRKGLCRGQKGPQETGEPLRKLKSPPKELGGPQLRELQKQLVGPQAADRGRGRCYMGITLHIHYYNDL